MSEELAKETKGILRKPSYSASSVNHVGAQHSHAGARISLSGFNEKSVVYSICVDDRTNPAYLVSLARNFGLR